LKAFFLSYNMNYIPFILRFVFFFIIIITLDWELLDIFFPTEKISFILDLRLVYSVFFVFSFIICTILYYVYKKNFDIVGYVYLIITTIKMGLAYVLAKPLVTQNEVLPIEKYHFFILFFIFLIIETLLTILLLNKKQIN
jgi:hypothetical protein